MVCGWCAQRRAADGVRHHGAAPGSIYRRPKAVRGEKISADKLCAATMAQRCRGVPRTAGRFNLQWGMAQAWIAEGGPAGRTCTRASSSCCSLSLLVASSQVRQRRVRVRQRGVSLGQGPLARRDVSMVHQKLRRRWRTTCKLLHACCWQEWRSVPGAGA